MATGIVKGEKVGKDALTADLFAEEPFPLPDANAQVLLSYPEKVSEADILAPIEHNFVRVSDKGRAVRVRIVKPNAFIVADNFFGLKRILQEYAGSVTLIYLDPPFATGMDFHSRGLQHAYVDRFGSATYLEFMRRRLVLMRELLSSDGSLYLHIGHQMLFHVKVILDEVFGKANFRNLIVRKKCSSKNYTKNQYSNLHDYILFYTKTKNYKWNQPGLEPSKDWIEREYPKIDVRGRYKLVPVHAPGIRKGETGKEWRGRMPPPGKHWQFIPEKLDELDRRGEIHWSRNENPRRKVYLPQGKALPLTDYWDAFRDAHHQSIEITGYPTEKNLDLLKTIVGAATDEDDLVIDPFAGSGSTLHAAHDMKRQWFGIDESMTAVESAVRRLRHGIAPMGDYVERASAPVVDLFEREERATQPALPAVTTRVKAEFELIVDESFYNEHKQSIEDLAAL